MKNTSSLSAVRDPAAWEITHKPVGGEPVTRPLLAARDLASDQFSQVREFPRYPGQHHRTCEYMSVTTGDYIGCESGLERRIAQVLDFEPEVVNIISQPFGVHVRADGDPLVPDFMVDDRSGARRVIDVCPEEFVRKERRTVGFQFKRAACELLGWEYEILTEPPAAVGDNVASLAAFRFPPPTSTSSRRPRARRSRHPRHWVRPQPHSARPR